jgi:hypothetical protein
MWDGQYMLRVPVAGMCAYIQVQSLPTIKILSSLTFRVYPAFVRVIAGDTNKKPGLAGMVPLVMPPDPLGHNMVHLSDLVADCFKEIAPDIADTLSGK